MPTATDEQELSALLVQLREKLQAWNTGHGSPFPGITDGPGADIRSELMPACRTFANRIDLLAALPKGGVFAEIGIYGGEFAVNILEINQPREFHTYNWDFKHLNPAIRATLDASGKIFYHEGEPDSAFKAGPPFAFDIIYLNKSKHYDVCRHELDYCMEKLNPEGISVVHDFIAWDPVQGIPCGVMPAVCQFVNEQSLEVIYMSLHPRGFCDIAVRRGPSAQSEQTRPEAAVATHSDWNKEKQMAWPWITISGTAESSPLAMACHTSLEAAMESKGRMDEGIYSVAGFCGRKFRLFLNNLIRMIEEPRYLEIGVYGGATLCAAIEGNTLRAVGVDDWSWGAEQGNDVIKHLYRALAVHKPASCALSLIENDFRKVPYQALGPFNVIFYDGPHAEQDQYDGIKYPFAALADRAIVIVDDWNWIHVRNGTLRALKDLGAEIEFAIDLRSSQQDEGNPEAIVPGGAGMHSEWHNGFYAAVIRKAP